MKLEQSDKNFLFSETKLPDVFFTEYMSQANGDYIKVYLYIVFLSKYNKEVKINDVSKTLNIPFKTIQEAIAYWEEQEVLIKKNNGYIVVDLQEKELNKLYSPRLTSTPENALSNAKNQYRAKAIEDINNTCFQGMMSPSWYNDIDLWFNKYGFDDNNFLFFYYNVNDKKYYFYNENSYFTAASTIKVPVAMYYYDEINSGSLSLNSTILYASGCYEAGSRNYGFSIFCR